MIGWVLILALIGPTGNVVQLAPVAAPFATWEDCNHAGVLSRANLPALASPQASNWNRVDWVCVKAVRAP